MNQPVSYFWYSSFFWVLVHVSISNFWDNIHLENSPSCHPVMGPMKNLTRMFQAHWERVNETKTMIQLFSCYSCNTQNTIMKDFFVTFQVLHFLSKLWLEILVNQSKLLLILYFQWRHDGTLLKTKGAVESSDSSLLTKCVYWLGCDTGM